MSDSEVSVDSDGESCDWSDTEEVSEVRALHGQVCDDGSNEAIDIEDLCRRRVSGGNEKTIEMKGLSRRMVSDGAENDSDMDGLSTRNVWDGTEQASDSGGLEKKNREDLSETRTFYPSFEHLHLVLRENSLNWFSFVEELKLTVSSITEEALDQLLMDFVYFLSSSDLTPEEDAVVEQSRQAYLAQRRQTERENAEVTTD